ncbi:hypothetical protein RhiirC2_869045 [Rhizophagus irregularis]|uniref:Uncharacterized protein n=1 Tax=Rhizophagus irregularis TaxID=588596 RepID=A0A2N1MTG2_9GLOM|nr:hypothetical protein RhiirC2_869045 [Rhizophagus irregularis]
MSGIHEYFKKNPTNWNFIDFLNECDTEPFDAKGEYKNQTKRTKTDLITDSKIDKFFSPVHVEGNNDHDDEEIILEPQSHKDDIPEEELEDNLLQENSGAPVDFKLIINNICIRSTMERWRKSTKYIDEIHKQEGEKTLRCSAILLNRSLKDDNRRCSGNKIDAIMSILDIGLEFSTLEVSGSPSKPDHIHYVGDRNKTAKMLKIILNYVYIKYSGDFEKFRRIKCTVYKYMITTYMYIVCAAICWNLLFQTRDDVLLSNNCILTFQRVANFCFKLMDVAGKPGEYIDNLVILTN